MTQTLPSALAEPVVTPPARWVWSLSLVNLGIMSGWFGPIQVLLAEQARDIAPGDKEAVLSLVLGVGAAVSTICNPLFGAFSDRTTWRRGRRLPWVVGGAVGGALCLGLLSIADSVAVMLLAWCGVQAFLNAMYAAVMASIPDQVPVDRRGLIGGMVAIAQTIGIVAGVGIASATGSVAAGYLATILWLVVLTLPYALGSRDLALPTGFRPEPFRLGRFVRSFWISPRQHPDFAWAWITRFMVNLGNYIGTLYLLFYVTDGLGISARDADDRVLVLTALYAVTTVATTAVFGHWSDRIGKRKVFVIWSQALAPVCAGIILTTVAALGGTVETGGEGWSAGYGAVYGFSFAVSLLGSVLVTRIRSVP